MSGVAECYSEGIYLLDLMPVDIARKLLRMSKLVNKLTLSTIEPDL